MTRADRLLEATARELARQAYVREFGQAQAKRWREDVEAWIDERAPLFLRPARELLEALTPLLHDPGAYLEVALAFGPAARSRAEAEALAVALGGVLDSARAAA